MRAEEQRAALRPSRLPPPADETRDEVLLVRGVVRRPAGVEDYGFPGRQAERSQQLLVLGTGALPVVDVRLRPARDDDARGIDPVVALEVASHDLVLDDVPLEVRRDDALPDLVIPARDVPDRRYVQPASSREHRHGRLRLRAREDDRLAVAAHSLE